jgi:hypothetical protein
MNVELSGDSKINPTRREEQWVHSRNLKEDILSCDSEHVFYRPLDQCVLPVPHDGTHRVPSSPGEDNRKKGRPVRLGNDVGPRCRLESDKVSMVSCPGGTDASCDEQNEAVVHGAAHTRLFCPPVY